MKIQIEIDEKTLRRLVMEHVSATMGSVVLTDKDVLIEVRSVNKSEWEVAAFRARADKTV